MKTSKETEKKINKPFPTFNEFELVQRTKDWHYKHPQISNTGGKSFVRGFKLIQSWNPLTITILWQSAHLHTKVQPSPPLISQTLTSNYLYV